jgi:uncharacterized protein YoxC
MTIALQIILCLAVITLTVYLVLLLAQARRTVAAMERLADSVARDLRQASEDVHEIRKQIDITANRIRTAFELPAALREAVDGVTKSIPTIFQRGENAISMIEMLLTGVQTAVHFFHRPKANPPKEATHE